METKFQVPTKDGHIIYGVKNSSGKQSNKAIYIVHGFTGHIYEYAFKRAADYFESEYDVYRFYLYTDETKARNLEETTLRIHADDLNTLLNEFAHLYDQNFLIGHSFGGPTVMLANPDNITAVSLWDPSFNLTRSQKVLDTPTDARPFYSINWGMNIIVGEQTYQEMGQLDEPACIELSKNFKNPIQVVHAGEGSYILDGVSYHSYCVHQKRHDVVAGTSHCFYEGQACDELLEKTAQWFLDQNEHK